MGIGTAPVQQGEVAPLNSVGYGGLNTGISQAGIAEAGTRIAIRFSGIPQGASVQVPTVVNLIGFVFGFSGPSPATTGVMVLTNADSAGAGVFSASSSGTLSGNLAVYEVLWADPFSTEHAEIPYTLINAPPGTALGITTGYAPFYTDAGSQQASSVYPVPRFLDSANECGGQSCLNITPSQGLNSGPVQVMLTEFGSQSLTGAQVLLRASGAPDIFGASLSNPAGNTLAATFNLSDAPPGTRDVIVTPAGGSTITLAGGFSVLQSPACAYSVGPQSIHVPASGGSGALVVTPSSPQCSWSASPSAGWIQLLAASADAQPYSIGVNSSTTQLTGAVSIAGETIPAIQDGASSCTYNLSTSSEAFGVNGGGFTVNVTTQSGCAWNTVSNLSWVTFPSGSSGSGSGPVTIQTAANTVGFLSGTLTIAGQAFAVSQDASSCGGTDVSRQVEVSIDALLSQWNGNGLTQQVRLASTGAGVSGPVSVIFYGLCSTGGPLFCPFQSSYSLIHCGQFLLDYPSVLVAPNGLAAGQSVYYDLQFYANPYGPGILPPGSVSYSVISGTPGQ
jgi:hypothetical protein